MKEYNIIIADSPEDFRRSGVACIDEYVWGGTYRPKANARLIFVPGDGFYAKLTAYEKHPKAVYENDMDPVYKDSCLEFFAAYKPGGYINCEMNANGAVLSAYGKDRYERTPLNGICGRFPSVTAKKYTDRWTVTAHITLDMIKKVYGSCDYAPGDVIYGNFYKCGDGCEFPHYGSYAPVETEKPDFHRPEFFVPMRLKEV